MVAENRTKNVLIVEDDESILLFLKYLLDLPGCRVQLARDGMEAMSAITNSPPDLVLLDLMIPKIDGINICKMIKTSPAFAGVKVILMSALRYQLDHTNISQLGADAAFTKPIDPEEMVRTAKSLLSI